VDPFFLPFLPGLDDKIQPIDCGDSRAAPGAWCAPKPALLFTNCRLKFTSISVRARIPIGADPSAS